MQVVLSILRDLLRYYLIIMNVLSFVCMGVDKLYAVRGCWRIPEATLLMLCAIGGSVGGYAGMWVFRHKIRKPKFAYGVPVMIAVHLFLFFILF